MLYLKKSKKQILALCLTAALSIGSFTAYAATEHWNDASTKPQVTTKTSLSDDTNWAQWKAGWDNLKTNYQQVALTPGADFSKLNFGWYSEKQSDSAIVRIADNKEMNNAKEFKGTCQPGAVINEVQYYSNKVTASGFKPNRTYYYQVLLNGQWQQAQQYKTGDPENFSFIFVGDPQIGSSYKQKNTESNGKKLGNDMAARNDSYNWNITLNKAMQQHPEIDFLVSPGDQISVTGDESPNALKEQEDQYSGYLSATVFRNLPQANAIGNHDCSTPAYKYHFNNPNTFSDESTPTPAGNGYYYTYGNALFIVINSNNFNAADHKTLIEKAVKAHPDTKWRIVVMHQDIYGSGLDHSDSDGTILRTQLTPIFDDNDIDVVLQGHDHSYARTYQLTSDGQPHDNFIEYTQGQNGDNHDKFDDLFDNNSVFRAYYKSQNLCYNIADKSQGTLVNPEGVFYLTANSATGSKFYNLIPQQQDYIAARNQNWRPSYSVINITADKFSVTTYDVETGSPIDETYTIIKNK